MSTVGSSSGDISPTSAGPSNPATISGDDTPVDEVVIPDADTTDEDTPRRPFQTGSGAEGPVDETTTPQPDDAINESAGGFVPLPRDADSTVHGHGDPADVVKRKNEEQVGPDNNSWFNDTATARGNRFPPSPESLDSLASALELEADQAEQDAEAKRELAENARKEADEAMENTE